ncbi:MAG: alpha-1,2-fucosyltransferase [Chloroflexota bacterium]
MVIIRVTGGLGNQMFQYIYGQALSQKYNQEVAYDLTWYGMSSNHRYRELESHEKFRLKSFGIEPRAISQNSSTFFHSKPGKAFNIVANKIFGTGVKPVLPTYLIGYWLGEQYFKNIWEDVPKIFKLPKITNKKSLNYKEQIKDSNAAVSLHVRMGDYKNYPHLQVCSPAYYKNAVNYLESKLPNAKLFVFSDDIKNAREVLGKGNDMVFVEDAGSDLDEFQLMAQCNHHVICNSTFSWWGAWLGEHTNKDDRLVLAPVRWFNQTDSHAHRKLHDVDRIIPPRWHKIEVD